MCKRLSLERSATFSAFNPRSGEDLLSRPTFLSHHIRQSKSAPVARPHKVGFATRDSIQGAADKQTAATAAYNYSITKTNHLTPSSLCDILRERGLGDPRASLPAPSEHRSNPLPLIRKRQRLMKRTQWYYIEKLKGKAMVESDVANAKAQTFCEEVKARKPMRTASAALRARRQMQKDSSSDLIRASQDDKDEDGDVEHVDDEDQVVPAEDLFEKIQTWMDNCRKAWATTQHDKVKRTKHVEAQFAL